MPGIPGKKVVTFRQVPPKNVNPISSVPCCGGTQFAWTTQWRDFFDNYDPFTDLIAPLGLQTVDDTPEFLSGEIADRPDADTLPEESRYVSTDEDYIEYVVLYAIPGDASTAAWVQINADAEEHWWTLNVGTGYINPTNPSLDVGGIRDFVTTRDATIGRDFNVTRNSILTGTLRVDGNADFNAALNVDGAFTATNAAVDLTSLAAAAATDYILQITSGNRVKKSAYTVQALIDLLDGGFWTEASGGIYNNTGDYVTIINNSTGQTGVVMDGNDYDFVQAGTGETYIWWIGATDIDAVFMPFAIGIGGGGVAMYSDTLARCYFTGKTFFNDGLDIIGDVDGSGGDWTTTGDLNFTVSGKGIGGGTNLAQLFYSTGGPVTSGSELTWFGKVSSPYDQALFTLMGDVSGLGALESGALLALGDTISYQIAADAFGFLYLI